MRVETIDRPAPGARLQHDGAGGGRGLAGWRGGAGDGVAERAPAGAAPGQERCRPPRGPGRRRVATRVGAGRCGSVRRARGGRAHGGAGRGPSGPRLRNLPPGAVPPGNGAGSFRPWPTAACSPCTPTPTTKPPRARRPSRCYKTQGVRSVLVTCTGGEEGEILNPAMDLPEVRADLHGVRMRELQTAADIIGYDEVVLLGYRDSGMPGSEANARPESFASADLERGRGPSDRGDPAGTTAGDPDLPRRPGRVPAPRPPPGARHHHPGVGDGPATRSTVPISARRSRR